MAEEKEIKEKKIPLPNKIVKVVPNKKSTSFIPDTNHQASFLAPRAGNEFVCPYLRNGQLKNILTNEEKEYIEEMIGEDLSIYKKHDNFWLNFKFDLGKDIEYLDLNSPIDYIKYKILLAWPALIATSKDMVETRRSYKYYMIDSAYETVEKARENDIEQEAWLTFSELKTNRPKMIQVLALYGKKVATNSTDDFISTQISDIFRKDLKSMQEFVDKVTDPDFDYRILIEEAVDKSALVRNRNYYFLPEGDKIANSTDELIDYLKSPKNQEVYMLIEQRVKNAT